MNVLRIVLGVAFLLTGVVLAEEGAGVGSGAAVTAAAPEGEPLMPYGTPGTRAAGPKSNFYGTGGNATRIVYLIDHSGLQGERLDFVREQVNRSVEKLVPVQLFNVIMVSENVESIMPAGQLVRATAEARKECAKKIGEYRVQGKGDDVLEPLKQGFEEAFKAKPQIIYFLSSGRFDPKILEVVDTLNKDKKVRIHTVAYLSEGAENQEQLKTMAKNNGGTFTNLEVKEGPPASGPATTAAATTAAPAATASAPATTTRGAAADPESKFYGNGAAATRIVYIVDHSGSTLDNFDFLREEVKRSIDALTPVQFFNVVMVSEEVHTVMPAGKLARASAEAKKEFADKIAEYRARGMNDNLLAPFQQAFEEAFKSNAEVIYFITDGHFDPKLMDVIDKLNKDTKVRINTLAFINKDSGYEEQLQTMAKKNGGVYKFVSERDLGR